MVENWLIYISDNDVYILNNTNKRSVITLFSIARDDISLLQKK